MPPRLLAAAAESQSLSFCSVSRLNHAGAAAGVAPCRPLLAAFIACLGGEGPESQEIGKDFEGGFFLMRSNFF